MKRVRLTTKIDAWGRKWPKGTVLEVQAERDLAWQVVFPTSPEVVGTITKRDAEEIGE